MALDEPTSRLFIGCRRPARLAMVDTASGNFVTSVDVVGDTDDLFYDDGRRRVYVIGGDGFVDVLRRDGDRLERIGRVTTRAGARTGLWVATQGRLYVAVPARSGEPAEIRSVSSRERVAMTRARLWSAGAVLLAALLTAPNALAQQQNPCRILCAPELLIEPTWTIENLALRPRVEHPDGTQEQVPRESVFELVLAVDVPTRLRRIGFTGEIILAPTRTDNAPELEFELNLDILQPEQTGGWVKSHFDVVDQFGPIERPDAGPSPYTDRLDFELDTAFAVLKRMSSPFLRSIEVEGSLDYLATGLPRRGDVIDGLRYLDDASPWSFSVVLVIPVAPF